MNVVAFIIVRVIRSIIKLNRVRKKICEGMFFQATTAANKRAVMVVPNGRQQKASKLVVPV